ncbi:MAG: serine/threonine protein kinase [Nannocystis sp.]|nr:serine/threonine protein kinase [Nannocystis sp.]
MGEVMLAYDDQLDRRVALKIVRARGQRAGDVYARMLREAQGLARLSHPNVVQVYEAGDLDGEVYLAMEYVEGETLRTWSKSQERPWREVLQRCVEAGRGLQAAHEAGLVHRDFKPYKPTNPTRTPISPLIGCNPTNSGVLAGLSFF